MVTGRRQVEVQKDGREWRLLGLLYADDLVLYDKVENELRGIAGHFDEMSKRDLKINACKNKVMVLGRKKELECEVCADGIHLDHALGFKYLESILNKSIINEAECNRKVASGKRIANAIKSLRLSA